MGLAARVVIGLVLLWAGISKVRDRNWAATTAPVMQLPVEVLRFIPFVELVIGAACVAQVPFAAVTANGLLLGYLVLTVNLAQRGDAPPCACFGATATPVTWRTVGRNVVLVAVSIVSVLA
jgi:hypothetical protein